MRRKQQPPPRQGVTLHQDGGRPVPWWWSLRKEHVNGGSQKASWTTTTLPMPTLTMTRWLGWLVITSLMTGSRREQGWRRNCAGAKVVEDNPKGSVVLRPVRKTIYKRKPRAINVDKNLSEAAQKRVNGLVSMFLGMGSYKPAGILTDTLRAEWNPEADLSKDCRKEGSRCSHHWPGSEVMAGTSVFPGEPGATRSSRDGGPGPVLEPHSGASTSTPGVEVDEQERQPGAGSPYGGDPRRSFQLKGGDPWAVDRGVSWQRGVLGCRPWRLTKSHWKPSRVSVLWASEQAIETWIGKLGLGDKALLMTARVRRAWAAVGLYYRQVVQDRSKIALSDLDTMLGETELRDTKQQFWRRCKMRFPPEIHPADTTICRVARETQKRMLCVYNIWKVKTLQFQLTTSQKKRKLSDGLFIEDGEDEEVVAHDVDNYLDRLFTLLLAYAMAGCAGVTGAPDAAQELNLGADTTKFVNVPLDVIYKYDFRAKCSIMVMPLSQRLQWLQTRDVEERSEWVSKFRESTMSLGQVICDPNRVRCVTELGSSHVVSIRTELDNPTKILYKNFIDEMFDQLAKPYTRTANETVYIKASRATVTNIARAFAQARLLDLNLARKTQGFFVEPESLLTIAVPTGLPKKDIYKGEHSGTYISYHKTSWESVAKILVENCARPANWTKKRSRHPNPIPVLRILRIFSWDCRHRWITGVGHSSLHF